MTSTSSSETSPARVLRSSLRLIVPVAVMGSVLLASPALADVPENWTQPDSVSALQFLLILVGLPLGGVALITLLFYAPILARGEKISSSSSPVEDQWLGGPRAGRGELEGSSSSEKETGGASGTW
ncbi:hypothetical protein [Nocardioides campestrisoli]|uniref:hypothetical protein n=1 Tax=Nocardioides campestrisoli TaxID=2736757 RepID=UPI0015E6B774|nr:hypothetical protein [Nocardioides campestrisoli]